MARVGIPTDRDDPSASVLVHRRPATCRRGPVRIARLGSREQSRAPRRVARGGRRNTERSPQAVFQRVLLEAGSALRAQPVIGSPSATRRGAGCRSGGRLRPPQVKTAAQVLAAERALHPDRARALLAARVAAQASIELAVGRVAPINGERHLQASLPPLWYKSGTREMLDSTRALESSI